MPSKKVKVLYIAGSGRSGSTILGRILGQYKGFFFAGELCKIWRYGLMENRVCGCGLPFKDCAFWKKIMYMAFGDQENIDGHEIYNLRQKSAYMRHIPRMLVSGNKSLHDSNFNKFADVLQKLYHAIQAHTGCRVIVDCSKTAPYGYVLESLRSIDLYILHLVRDPRGVAYAKLQKYLYQPGDGNSVYAGQAGVMKSSVIWNVQNYAVEAFWKKHKDCYLRIHYENFATDPVATLTPIIEMMNEDTSSLPFIGKHRVTLDEKTHTAAGNPVRFNAGTVDIKLDQTWQENMSSKNKRLIKLATFPLFKKYGYR